MGDLAAELDAFDALIGELETKVEEPPPKSSPSSTQNAATGSAKAESTTSSAKKPAPSAANAARFVISSAPAAASPSVAPPGAELGGIVGAGMAPYMGVPAGMHVDPSLAHMQQQAVSQPDPYNMGYASSNAPRQPARAAGTAGGSSYTKATKVGGAGPRKFVRAAAGEVWEDKTLEEWPDNDFRLFVGDLGNECNDNTLSNAFSRYSSFAKAKVLRDKKTGKSKGFGFVSFLDPFEASKALKEMNGKYIGNRPIKLKKSTWKDRSFAEQRKGKNKVFYKK